MIWIIILLLIFILQVLTIIIAEHKHPPKAVAWLFIHFVFPVVGFVMYYFMAQHFQKRKTIDEQAKVSQQMREQAQDRRTVIKTLAELGNGSFVHQERLYKLLQSFSHSPITSLNCVEVLQNGEETYAAILTDMEKAQHHLHIEYYTIRDDEIGQRFKEVMIRKSHEGVQVRLIYDGLGSRKLKERFIRELHEAGVQTRCFLPPHLAFFDKQVNFRNHRKIVVIDGKTGFTGGLNVGNEYLGKDPRLGFWRDTHLRLQGDAVYSLQDIFMRDWWFTSREKLNDPGYMPPHACEQQEQVQIVTSGPDNRTDAILELIVNAIGVAKKRIYITTPYFIPDKSILMGLRTAAQSGVDVRIMIPQVADSRLVMYAGLSYIEDLMQAGVRFYRYQKGFLHAKVLIVDELLASVGTANMDMRSFFSNFELNAILFDNKSIDTLSEDFERDLLDCHIVSLSEHKKRSRLQRLKESGARMLSPLL